MTGEKFKRELHIEELELESGEYGVGCGIGLLARTRGDIIESGSGDREREFGSAGTDFLQMRVGTRRGG